MSAETREKRNISDVWTSIVGDLISCFKRYHNDLLNNLLLSKSIVQWLKMRIYPGQWHSQNYVKQERGSSIN